MKNLIVYESIHHKNTEKIAIAMAKQLEADLIKASDIHISSIENYDLIGFGSGIYNGNFHNNILNLIENIPNTLEKKVFIFSTSGTGNKKYNNNLEGNLKEKNLNIIGNFSCKGYDTNGIFKLIGGIAKNRPNENDIKVAINFVDSLKILK